jgi:hypothetical protein
MKRYLLAICVVLLAFNSSWSQCSITGLNVTYSACNENAQFFATLSFDHTGTGEKFKLVGNGKNYGTYAYSVLPLKIGPLRADCTTNYEFLVVDENNSSCSNFVNPGKKCCDNTCKLEILAHEASICDGLLYNVAVDIKTNSTQKAFDVYHNGKFHTFIKSDSLSFKIEKLLSSTTELYNNLVICVNDNPKCCDTINILNPCSCNIYNLRTQIVECNAADSTFDLRINFKHQLTSDSFRLGGNNTNYGTYAYKDLPIRIKGLKFSTTKDYEFLVVDKNNSLCFAAYELGYITDCNHPCSISDMSVKADACNDDGTFFAILSFTDKNTSVDGFIVRGNGKIYGEFDYGASNYKIGPLAGDCKTIYEFVVIDRSIEGCRMDTSFKEKICCDAPCALQEMVITELCENNKLNGIKINFQVKNPKSESFHLSINGIYIGKYKYADLPITVSSDKLSGTVIKVKVSDTEQEPCFLIKEYTIKCNPEKCILKDLKVKTLPCDDQGKFFVLMTFVSQATGNKGFLVKVNGITHDTLTYGKSEYKLGPFEGDCKTKYRFVIIDLQYPDCAAEFGFGEVICCEPKECKMGNPIIKFNDCVDKKYSINLNFEHENTGTEFNVKINGVFYKTFKYSDLPVKIEGLTEKKAHEIGVWDKANEACRFVITIPGIECTSSTTEIANQPLVIYTDHSYLYFVTKSPIMLDKVSLISSNGSLLSQQNDHTSELPISIEYLSTGLYFVNIMKDGQSKTLKFMKN